MSGVIIISLCNDRINLKTIIKCKKINLDAFEQAALLYLERKLSQKWAQIKIR